MAVALHSVKPATGTASAGNGYGYSSVPPQYTAFDPGSGSDRLLLSLAAMAPTHAPYTLNNDGTYGGVAMTRGAAGTDAVGNEFRVYSLLAPSSTPGNIQYTGTNTDQRLSALVCSFTGTSGLTAYAATNHGSTNNPTKTLNCPTGSIAVMFGFTFDVGTNARLTAADGTSQFDEDMLFAGFFLVTKDGAGASTTIGATSTAARTWHTIVLSVDAAGGGSSTTPLKRKLLLGVG